MRIAQIVLPDASQYERKSQRADRAVLSEKHEVMVFEGAEDRAQGAGGRAQGSAGRRAQGSAGGRAQGGAEDRGGKGDRWFPSAPCPLPPAPSADVAHVYGPIELPAKPFLRFPLPYVANGTIPKSRWRWRKPKEPEFVLSPLGDKPLPEAVEDHYFAATRQPGNRATGQPKTIGSYNRPATLDFIARTVARLNRFRDDVTWNLYETPPTPEDLAAVDVWVDPAVSAEDFDGFVAEALVVGTPVVASRTAINELRLERGRTGLLVPVNDANEMTHAILAALFKPEVADSRLHAARQTISKFRARQRSRILVHMYETLNS